MKYGILSHNIKYYRKLAGFTQEKLSEMLGISTQAVSKWEQGLSCPDIELLPAISEIMNVTIDELFGKMIEKEVIFSSDGSTPWRDDNKLRIVIYSGKKVAHQSTYDVQNGKNTVSFSCMDNDFDMKGICSYSCSDKRQQAYKKKYSKEN